MKKISQFPQITTRNNDDWLLIEEASTGAYKRIKVSDFIAGLSGSTSGTTQTLTYASNGDTNGVCYLLGTNYGAIAWTNPHTAERLTCSISSSFDGSDQPANLVNRAISSRPATQNIANSWMKIDLGLTRKLKCNYYSLQGRDFPSEHLRSWKLQGSNDNSTWIDLDTQNNNTSINQNTWLSLSVTSNTAYRYFRILQTAESSGGTNIMTLGEWEFYGDLITN